MLLNTCVTNFVLWNSIEDVLEALSESDEEYPQLFCVDQVLQIQCVKTCQKN